MDGVIADFHKRYYEIHNTSPASDDARKRFGQRFAMFIQNKEFQNLDMMPDAHILLSYLNTCGVPVEILSSTARPVNNEAISRQKEVWLGKHNINYPANFVPGKNLKYKFADENSIIIDDTQSVIDDWNKAGGMGVLHKDALTTIAILDTLLRG
jgi:hypothetical protein